MSGRGITCKRDARQRQKEDAFHSFKGEKMAPLQHLGHLRCMPCHRRPGCSRPAGSLFFLRKDRTEHFRTALPMGQQLVRPHSGKDRKLCLLSQGGLAQEPSHFHHCRCHPRSSCDTRMEERQNILQHNLPCRNNPKFPVKVCDVPSHD